MLWAEEFLLQSILYDNLISFYKQSHEQDDEMKCLKSWMLKFAEIQQFLKQFCLYILKSCISLDDVISLYDKTYCQFSNKKNNLRKSKFFNILIFQFLYSENCFHYLILLIQSIVFSDFFWLAHFMLVLQFEMMFFSESCLL